MDIRQAEVSSGVTIGELLLVQDEATFDQLTKSQHEVLG